MLIKVDEDSLEMPETKYQCEVTMESCEFSRICDAMEGISGLLTLSAQQDCVMFSVEGVIGSGQVTLAASELTTIEIKEPVKLSFSLPYLQKFARAAALSPFVKIHLHHDKPLMLLYSLTKNAGNQKG